MTLETLFQECAPEQLENIIGKDTLEVLRNLEPKFSDNRHLGNLASKILDPFDLINDQGKREQIIDMLSEQKAQELATRLNLGEATNVYSDIKLAAANDKKLIPELLSFFGIMREERAAAEESACISKVEPDYPLFDYQLAAALKIIDTLDQYPNKAILHMPTGSGKTRTAMHVVSDHLRSNEHTLVCWLAQSSELLEQAAEEFGRAWESLGNRPTNIIRFWGSKNTDLLAHHDGFVVAGLGKMNALEERAPSILPNFADRVSLVVIDEAHQAIAPTYASIISSLYSKRLSTKLLGLTATPGRTWSDISEDRKLSEFFDGNKVTLDIKDYKNPIHFLVAQGYLAQTNFRTLNVTPGFQISDADLREVSSFNDIPIEILERLGNDVQCNLKVLVEIEQLDLADISELFSFLPLVDNARLIAAILQSRNHEAFVITGTSHIANRQRIIHRFKK